MLMIVKNNLLNFKDAYIYQDTDYFKFSLDSLLLANFVTINLRDKNILDIATGNAPIPMLLSYRTNANIYGVEIQKSVFDLGVKSIIENKMDKQITIINDDAKNVINLFGDDYFDVITCNPPYFDTNNSLFENVNSVKAIARHEKLLNLDDIFTISKRVLKTNGRLAMVHRTERLTQILDTASKYGFMAKKIRFIYPKENRNSDLMLIEFVKGGKKGLKMIYPLIVYDSDGNEAKVTITITVVLTDNDAPMLTGVADKHIVVGQTFDPNAEVAATDAIDGNVDFTVEGTV